MIEEVELKPSVSALIQSLRSIGYSFNAAVSDIIDNSIAANASEIIVQVDSDNAGLFVAISDNGEGMNRDELLQAMALGSKNPLETRRNDDLGRFGMGLKTASFSQSKILTCVTSKYGKKIGAQWDLDRVVDGWKIQLFDGSACDRLIPSSSNHQDRGTTTVVPQHSLISIEEATRSRCSSILTSPSLPSPYQESRRYERSQKDGTRRGRRPG